MPTTNVDERETKSRVNKALQQREALLTKAENLYAEWENEDETPQEILDTIANLIGQADGIKAKIDVATRLTKSQSQDREEVPSLAMESWRQTLPGEGRTRVDDQSKREVKGYDMWGKEHTVVWNVPLGTETPEYKRAFETYLRKKPYEDLKPQEAKALSEGTDNSGGFFIPEEYMSNLIIKAIGLTAVRPNARVMSVSRDLVRWPRINYSSATDDSNGNIYNSPIRLTWSGEVPASATAIRITDPVAGVYQIPIHTAMASILMSNDLLEDSAFDIQSVYGQMLAEAFALGEDSAFLTGDGIAKPFGVLTTPGVTNYIGKTQSANFGGTHVVTFGDMVSLFYNVPAQYRQNGAWYMNSAQMALVEQIVDSQGRPIIGSLINGSGLQTSQFQSIKGRPVNVDEFMPAPTTASNAPIMYGDLSGYVILERVGLSVQRIDQLYAETNQTLLLARRRVGGQLVEPWKLQALVV